MRPGETPFPADGVEVPITGSGDFATTLLATSDGEWLVRLELADTRVTSELTLHPVQVDTTPPAVHVREPSGSRVLPRVDVAMDVDDAIDVATVTVNDVPAQRGDARRWSCTVDLAPGATELRIVATDAVGNATRMSHGIQVVRQGPVIRVDSPLPEVTREREVSLRGRVDDPDTAKVTWENQAVAVAADGTFKVTATLDREGDRSFELVAKDDLGPETRHLYHVRYDATAPTVAWTTPANDDVAPGTVVLAGTIADASAVTVRVNGAEAAVDNGQWTTSMVVVAPGLDIVVVARDAAGNETILAKRTLRTRATATIAWGTREADATDVEIAGEAADGVVAPTLDLAEHPFNGSTDVNLAGLRRVRGFLEVDHMDGFPCYMRPFQGTTRRSTKRISRSNA